MKNGMSPEGYAVLCEFTEMTVLSMGVSDRDAFIEYGPPHWERMAKCLAEELALEREG